MRLLSSGDRVGVRLAWHAARAGCPVAAAAAAAGVHHLAPFGHPRGWTPFSRVGRHHTWTVPGGKVVQERREGRWRRVWSRPTDDVIGSAPHAPQTLRHVPQVQLRNQGETPLRYAVGQAALWAAWSPTPQPRAQVAYAAPSAGSARGSRSAAAKSESETCQSLAAAAHAGPRLSVLRRPRGASRAADRIRRCCRHRAHAWTGTGTPDAA